MSLHIPPLAHFPPTSTYERADEVTSFCNDYITKHFPFDTNDDLEHFLSTDTPAFMYKVTPFTTNHEKLCKVSILNCFLFFFDDLVDKDGMALDKKAMLALQLLPAQDNAVIELGDPGKMSLFEISAELHRNLRADMPPADYDRYVRFMKEYLRAQMMTPLGSSNIEGWLEPRTSDSAAYIIFTYVRYAMEISMTEDETADPLLQRCQKVGADAAILTNEVGSYIKEVDTGSAQNNLITKIQEWSNCSESCARAQVESKIAELHTELHAICTQALDSPHLSTDAKRFVVAISYLVGGNIGWHTHSSRYAARRRDDTS